MMSEEEIKAALRAAVEPEEQWPDWLKEKMLCYRAAVMAERAAYEWRREFDGNEPSSLQRIMPMVEAILEASAFYRDELKA